MNIAIGGFFHESNTFNPIITDPQDFIVFEQNEIYAGRNAYLIAKGIIEYFENRSNYQLLPLVFAKAVPNGEIDEQFYNQLKAKFFKYLTASPKPDAFVLALHGSMRVQNIGSAETDLLKAIRQLYPEVPVFCALDMHATITTEMLEYADAFTGFKTAPHLDAYETGWQAAQIAAFALENNVRLTTGFQKITCLIAGEKSETDCEPMKSLIAELHNYETDPEVCAASYFLGFPWADTAQNGVTALVVTKNNQQKADLIAQKLADKFRENQAKFNFSVPAFPPLEALTQALRQTVKPVFVSDSGDNPTAGSAGDNTEIIRLLSSELAPLTGGKKVLLAGIFDPSAAKICQAAFQQKITLIVGGNFDRSYCQPVTISGTPVKVVEKWGLFKSDLILFQTANFALIITSKHIGFTGVEMFRALEIDYLQYDLIVPKLGYLTEDFKEIAAQAYLALTRGCTDEVLSRLKYNQQGYELI